SGSVSITVAKNTIGQELITCVTESVILNPLRRLNKQIVMIAVMKKGVTRYGFLIFRTMRNPSTATNGRRIKLPTHQIAVPKPNNPNKKTLNAAGLKICFFSIARKYLEAIATTPTATVTAKSVVFVMGGTIRKRISAVIAYDSLFAGALKSFDKAMFELKQ